MIRVSFAATVGLMKLGSMLPRDVGLPREALLLVVMDELTPDTVLACLAESFPVGAAAAVRADGELDEELVFGAEGEEELGADEGTETGQKLHRERR